MGSSAALAEPVGKSIRRDIPSLDGLRAVSIAIVVLSHTKSLLPTALVRSGLFRYVIGGGLHGVQVFFVISGYLITTLLLREVESRGDISMKRFYARRMIRIFPAFYAYLLVIAVLWMAGLSREDPRTFVAAATYTIAYLPNPQGWLVQHAWSLSIEEQFYLLWPGLLLIAYRRGWGIRLPLAVTAAMPVIRALIAWRVGLATLEHDRLIVNLSSIDMLMMGCLLAALSGRKGWRAWRGRWMRGWGVAGFLALGFVVVPYASAKLAGTSAAVAAVGFGYSITAVAIGVMVEFVVEAPESPAGRVLNLRVMRHLGLISYSIYLWQQLFTNSDSSLGVLTYPLILIAAEISFWLIERPAMRLRSRLGLEAGAS